MADILALLIVFGLLAALIGTLATGLLRIIGFGVLVALALIIGTPIIQSEIQVRSPLAPAGNGQSSDSVRQVPQQPPSTQLPVNGTATGGPAGTTYQTTGDTRATDGSTTGSRGIRAMW